jgi:hypothetical protein
VLRNACLALLSVAALVIAACGGQPISSPGATTPAATGQPTSQPTGQPTSQPTGQPTSQPTGQPTGAPSLDPALSDAGVVAQATLPNDTRGGRTGTHLIVGQASAGSQCGSAFDEDFLVVAWVEDAAVGELHRLSVSVPRDQVPEDAGVTEDIDGRVSFDFISESGFGTQYTGDSSGEDDGSSSIDVARAGDLLVFSFEGVTWDEVAFSGQAVCLED